MFQPFCFFSTLLAVCRYVIVDRDINQNNLNRLLGVRSSFLTSPRWRRTCKDSCNLTEPYLQVLLIRALSRVGGRVPKQ